MSIVPTFATLRNEASAVRLARYAQRIEYTECAFFGVNWEGNQNYQCRNIWSKFQRDNIAFYLAEAQQEIEDVLQFFLAPTWVVGTLAESPGYDPRLVDEQNYCDPCARRPCPGTTRWGRVIEPGIKATATVALAATVSQLTDPGVVTINPVTFTNTAEVRVYHPGTDIEIDPSLVTIAAGTLTILLPRCRTVKPEFADNPADGIDYATLTNFESTVDVKRVYNNPATNAVLAHRQACADAACSEHTHTACLYFNDRGTGIFEVSPANYNDVTTDWDRACLSLCHSPKVMRLYYRAGLTTLDRQMEDAVIRLAHSKMPIEPCGCMVTQRLWERDRFIPTSITRERANNPFGLSDGAWMAWKFVSGRRIYKMGVL